MSHQIRIRNTIKKIKYEESILQVNLSDPLINQTSQLLKELNINSEKFDISNLKFSLIKQNKKILIENLNKSLFELNFEVNDSLQIEEKIFEFSSQFCITIAYSGPIIIFFMFYFFYQSFSFKQWIIFLLVILHYSKRIYETNYVHIYGKTGFPFFSEEFVGLVFYYWILFGFFVGYYSLSADYALKNNGFSFFYIILIFLNLFSEYNNYKSHLILRNLKLSNDGNRGIPTGNMFQYVSNSHYFWELLSWLFFGLFVWNIPSFLFVIFSFISMGFLAIEKHKNIKKFFGEKYPRHLKAFIPFVL